MTAIEYLTLSLVVANIVVVVVAAFHFVRVGKQLKQSKKAMLIHKRYQVEGDITQIRLKRAEFLHKEGKKTEDGQSPMEILRRRECQCKETVDRIVEELRRLGVNS